MKSLVKGYEIKRGLNPLMYVNIERSTGKKVELCTVCVY